MRIAVTGATGFIGAHLAERLVQEGHVVKALVRKTSNTAPLTQLGVEIVQGDLLNDESIKILLDGAEIVFHLAAKAYWARPEEYWNTNYHGTIKLLEGSINRNIIRFVHVSTIGVMGNIEGPPADESHNYNPSSPYERSKTEAEKAALKYHREYKLPVSIVRPAIVYGPGNMYLVRLYQWIQRSGFRLIGDMNNFLHPSYVENLVDGIILAANKPAALGQIYIIADEEPVTWRRFVDEISKAVGAEPVTSRFGHFPVWLVKAAACLFEIEGRIVGSEPYLTRYWIRELTSNLVYDISRAKQELGYSPKVSLNEGVRRTAEWYMEKGYLTKK
jgi:nucleoside-diphosphate-sugar epimerase